MSNPKFELLDIFPVASRIHTWHELQLAKSGIEELREIKIYTCANDAVKAIIDESGNGDSKIAVEEALQKSKIYAEWQRIMPFLKNVPNLHAYRTKSRKKNNTALICGEIEKFGGYLPENQILYRGGTFDNIDFTIDDGPISATTMPSVAHWHAKEVSGHIAILRVAEDYKVKAYAYKTKGNQKFTHEFEVLIQNNITLKFEITWSHNGMSVYQYALHSI